MIETRRLNYFLKTVEEGSISRAARELGLAQPALSQQLLVLERELGARLLERTRTGVRLTVAGEALLPRAQLLTRQVELLQATVRQREVGVAGAATVGLLPTLGGQLAIDLITRLRETYPNVRLTIKEAGNSALVEGLGRGSIDLALIAARPSDDRLASTPVLKEAVVIVGASADEQPAAVDAGALAREPWIVPTSPNAVRAMLSAYFAETGLEPNIAVELDSLPLVLAAVRAGLGLSLLPETTIADAVAKGDLRIIPTAARQMSRTIHLCTRADLPVQPPVQAVLEVLQELLSTRSPPVAAISPQARW